MTASKQEMHSKVRNIFEDALLREDMTSKLMKMEAQKLTNLCKSGNDLFISLASMISVAVEGNDFTNVPFVLHLTALLARRGEVVVDILSGFKPILTFLVKHGTAKLSSAHRDLAIGCLTNVSKYKSGKLKLPQILGFISTLCDIIKQGKSDEVALFSLSMLSRLLELYENRTSFGKTVAHFSDTSFYDAVASAAVATTNSSATLTTTLDDFRGHLCRLLLHVTRIEQHCIPIARSGSLLALLMSTLRSTLSLGKVTVSAKYAVVSLMNLAGCPAIRQLLANTDTLVLRLVQVAALDTGGKTGKYCLAALLNLAWESPNRVLFMSVEGMLEVLVAAIRGRDAKAAMYAVGICCNLSCLAEQQLALGQCTRPDVVAALVLAVRSGPGFTQDDALGTLTNLSSTTENRAGIAKELQGLGAVMDYIRGHVGLCRQRAVLLLQNLSASHSSLDVLLQREANCGDCELLLKSLLKTCENEQIISGALNDCIEEFSNRRKELAASEGSGEKVEFVLHSALPGSSASYEGAARPSGVPISKEFHSTQLFEILKKTKGEAAKPRQHSTSQQPAVLAEQRTKEAHGVPGVDVGRQCFSSPIKSSAAQPFLLRAEPELTPKPHVPSPDTLHGVTQSVAVTKKAEKDNKKRNSSQMQPESDVSMRVGPAAEVVPVMPTTPSPMKSFLRVRAPGCSSDSEDSTAGNVAQPKEPQKRGRPERKKVSRREKGGVVKESGSHEKRFKARPPGSSRPSSGRKVNSTSTQMKAEESAVAEEKNLPLPSSLTERKGGGRPLPSSLHSNLKGQVKEHSARDMSPDSPPSLLPHAPSSPMSSRARSSAVSRREPEGVEQLQRFFFSQCYLKEDRASILVVQKVADLGIHSARELRTALARDSRLLESLGMSSVDLMRTLKGLESVAE